MMNNEQSVKQVEKKTCDVCGQEKVPDDFYFYTVAGKNYMRGHCKKCHSDKSREWKRANPEKWRNQKSYGKKSPHQTREHMRDAKRLSLMKNVYHITPQEYASLLEKQGYVCSICKQPSKVSDSQWPLAIDHCHKTGEVRGLLCTKCNIRLGTLESGEYRDFLKVAYRYLDTSGQSRSTSLVAVQLNLISEF